MGPKIKFYFDLAFSLGAGPQKNVHAIIAKIGEKIFLLLTFVKVALETKSVP